MLAEIMRMKFSIAVSGTHGKTTTTAMTAAVLEELDPTVIVGGKLVSLGSHARIGSSDMMVVEADEAYGSIEKFFPTIAVVTSIDADHLDYYKNVGEIGQTFLSFINKVPFYGSAIVCSDQVNIRQIIPHIERRYCTYGIENQADVMASDIQYDGPTSCFSVSVYEDLLGRIHLKMPGKHNVSNALAAVAAGLQMDIPFNQVKEALEKFRGVHRRFEVLGEAQGVIIVDDYAHNPTKLKAALSGACASYDRRIIAIFQPHRYGRVKRLADEFSKSFSQSDVLIVAPIYAANEAPIEGVTAEKLAAAIAANGHEDVAYISSKDQIVSYLIDIVRPNDVVITMGAGDIWEVGHKLLDQLKT
jgi:UDP-N-acetylmuramate--alanine ligase